MVRPGRCRFPFKEWGDSSSNSLCLMHCLFRPLASVREVRLQLQLQEVCRAWEVLAGSSMTSQFWLEGPMYVVRVRVELVRAVLHIHLLPESSFVVQPSTLLLDEAGSNGADAQQQQLQQRLVH